MIPNFNKVYENRICVMCGKEYQPHNARQKCCSIDCSNAMYRADSRRRSKEYRASEKGKRDAAERQAMMKEYRGGRHYKQGDKSKRELEARLAAKRNMDEIAKIASLSNGDYGKWVVENDGRATA